VFHQSAAQAQVRARAQAHALEPLGSRTSGRCAACGIVTCACMSWVRRWQSLAPGAKDVGMYPTCKR
jgi:hypothetical protein